MKAEPDYSKQPLNPTDQDSCAGGHTHVASSSDRSHVQLYQSHRLIQPGVMPHLHVLLQLCAFPLLVLAVLQPPRNLQFSSENFQHILTWEDPNNEAGVYYKVEYSKDYRPLLPSRDCTNITIPRCDLTRDFVDIIGNYAAEVQIFTHDDSSEPTFSSSIFPLSDTFLGPPIVDVSSHDNELQVSIRPPVSHLWSEKEQRNVTMLSENVFPLLLYTIQLVSSMQVRHYEVEVYSENYKASIIEVLGSTNYCVSVNASYDLNVNSIASPIKCIFTKAPQVRGDGRIYCMIFVVLVVILMVGLVLFTNIMHQAGSSCRRRIAALGVLESFPRLKRFLEDNNESSPLIFIPLEVIRIEEDQRTEQAIDTNHSSLSANNGIIV